jgi:VanZ family protein
VKNFARYQLPAILWALVIFTLSSFPRLPTPVTGLFSADKLLHFGAYFIFGVLVAIALVKSTRQQRASTLLLLAACIGVLYGASDELHQSFVPGRDASVADWLADSFGVIAAQFSVAFARAKTNLSLFTNG